MCPLISIKVYFIVFSFFWQISRRLSTAYYCRSIFIRPFFVDPFIEGICVKKMMDLNQLNIETKSWICSNYLWSLFIKRKVNSSINLCCIIIIIEISLYLYSLLYAHNPVDALKKNYIGHRAFGPYSLITIQNRWYHLFFENILSRMNGFWYYHEQFFFY